MTASTTPQIPARNGMRTALNLTKRGGKQGGAVVVGHDAIAVGSCAAGERLPAAKPEKKITIGAVCKQLEQEFPDISISKIRYLEDQKLISPQRTNGGYRLYSQTDVEQLKTVLRLQRDEFLPLRVIRQELALGRTKSKTPTSPDPSPRQPPARLNTFAIHQSGSLHTLEQILDETGADSAIIAELHEFGLITGVQREGSRYYDDTEREIIRAAAELGRYGVGGRNLRVFRTSAEREVGLVEQILAPALNSRNPERRKEAVEAVENLAAVASHLKHLLMLRDLRRLVK